MIVPVSDPEDPRLAAYGALKDRDVAGRSGGFIVEGAIALERLITAGRFPLNSVFLSQRAADRLAALLRRLDSHIPVYVAPQAAMDRLIGYPIHRGVLALASRTPSRDAGSLLAGYAGRPLTLLVLIGLSNHDNVGACFRNASALGADAILLDGSSCDPLYRKAIRVSSGASLSLPFAHGLSGEELIGLLAAHDVTCWAMTPSASDHPARLVPPQRLALVLGAEGPGLTDRVMRLCRRVAIPMQGGMDSLNVATAGAVALACIALARTG